ncbi:MAG: hypothetical protein M0Q53_17495 [Prolixibacteraceae bacterium]|jgi:hypothetical protein|nr:hypothetical protein [Prolixibacteraceae bacterium]
MRQFYILLFSLLVGTQLIQAQDSRKLESIKGKVLTEYGNYFSQVTFTGNGNLRLIAMDKYFILTNENKRGIIKDILSDWQETLILVTRGSQNELWGRSIMTGEVSLLNTWDRSGSQSLVQTVPESNEQQKFTKHPWFFYIGEQGMFDSDHNINFSLNTRLGFFLLANKWDLAATYSINFSGNDMSKSNSSQSNYGVMSKVYFPIKEYNISPNIGGEISLVSNTDAQKVKSQTFNKSILIGLSWYIGFGSLDIGFRTGKEFTTMIGFTIIPKFNKKK